MSMQWDGTVLRAYFEPTDIATVNGMQVNVPGYIAYQFYVDGSLCIQCYADLNAALAQLRAHFEQESAYIVALTEGDVTYDRNFLLYWAARQAYAPGDIRALKAALEEVEP